MMDSPTNLPPGVTSDDCDGPPPNEVDCECCEGTGKLGCVQSHKACERECPTCEGTGKVDE